MNANLYEVILYFCQNYRRGEGISISKLAKFVYLADWKSAIKYKKQITDIQWKLYYTGPFSIEINETNIRQEHNLRIFIKESPECGEISMVKVINKSKIFQFMDNTEQILKSVLQSVEQLSWPEFLDFIYGTFPFMVSERFTNLDLPKLAQLYQQEERQKQENHYYYSSSVHS